MPNNKRKSTGAESKNQSSAEGSAKKKCSRVRKTYSLDSLPSWQRQITNFFPNRESDGNYSESNGSPDVLHKVRVKQNPSKLEVNKKSVKLPGDRKVESKEMNESEVESQQSQ